MDPTKKGKVYIIGAGPGDPGLITLRGIQCLEASDVIVYDYLASPELLRYARKDARLIYAGKQGGDHTIPQEELNRILVEEANKGFIVTRLKGGDPFIFGRGGEEAEELSRAGISFEVVPGVTSAVAVPAYAGIPLTHRGYTSTVAFVTGHEDPAKEKSDIDWKALSKIGTLVFLMGVKNLEQITGSLLNNGKSPFTPAALIQRGTTSQQKTVKATLGDIAEKVKGAQIASPAILVVGEVVGLREQMNWFESKPLFGRGVVITRPEQQADEMARMLQKEGARVILFPTIRIEPPESWADLDAALANIESYQWVIFTSANGVRFFFGRLRELARDVRDLRGINVCAIGPATADEIARLGIRVDIVPDDYISEGVVKSYEGTDLQGKRILLPRAAVARDVIPWGLERLGATVDVVTAYRTVGSGIDRSELLPFIEQGKLDVVTFTSPSTVRHFVEIMGRDYQLPPAVKVACIGPVTVAAAKKAGFTVDIFQESYTVPGLVDALVEYYARKEAGTRFQESGKK
jgi:uroporphyrinogen III methyltransferase/synthase